MDIYKARELQKLLFKESCVDYKFMKINIINGKLCYFVGHRICDNLPIEMTASDACRISKCIRDDVHYLIDALTEGRIRRTNVPIRSPAGVYVLEYIEID